VRFEPVKILKGLNMFLKVLNAHVSSYVKANGMITAHGSRLQQINSSADDGSAVVEEEKQQKQQQKVMADEKEEEKAYYHSTLYGGKGVGNGHSRDTEGGARVGCQSYAVSLIGLWVKSQYWTLPLDYSAVLCCNCPASEPWK
jgi:hypothetical protein